MKKDLVKCIIPIIVLLGACKKDDKVVAPPELAATKGIYVLSEGTYSGNDSKLAYRDASSGSVFGDFFVQQNPSVSAGLGDTGNDMIIYGSKMYIVMNGSGNVTVLNAATATLLSQISFGGLGSGNRNPRYALGVKGKVFITCWDNTVSIIDTTSLQVSGSIAVGANPEGIISSGNYLYVANSGALNYPDYDSTVSVVDMSTMMEIKKIKVGLNPQQLEVNSTGDVYVSAYGDAFATVPVPASISVISSSTNMLKTTLGTDYQFDHIRIFNDTAYMYSNYGNTIKVYNTISNTLIRNSFIADATPVTVTYGLNIDEQNGDVYVGDAGDFSVPAPGMVTCFNRNGVKKFSFSTAPGLNPNKILFVR